MRQISFQISLMVMATMLGVSLSGCFGQNDAPTTTAPAPEDSSAVASPASEPSPVVPEDAASPPAPPEAGTTSVATLPRDLDLIPSTNPDQRVQAVQNERSDPFSVVPTTPSVSIEITDDGSSSQSAPAPVSGQPAQSGQASGGGTSAGSGQVSGGGQPAASGGALAPIPNLVPVRPPQPPQPTLARAVAVLGVVQIGNVPYAIVNAPNEPSSRYVRAGQQLSNGQVVVRRIEVSSPTPTVVFVQHGIEVVTAVGEGGVPETTEDVPAAALSVRSPQQSG